MATEIEIAWAAGLFEGEGSWSLQKQDGQASLIPRAALQMSDFDVVREFHRVVEVGSTGPIRRDHRQAHYKNLLCWRASCSDAIYVAYLLLPHLGQRRSERALELINWYEATYWRRCPGCGSSFLATMHHQYSCSKTCNWRMRNLRFVADGRRIRDRLHFEDGQQSLLPPTPDSDVVRALLEERKFNGVR